MKTVRLHGGLGNQLFCFAFAHSLARASGEAVALDISSFRHDRYQRSFESGFAAAFPEFRATSACVWANAIRRAARLLPGAGVVREPSGRPAGMNDLARRRGYFSGYWQNEDYILDAPAFVAKLKAYLCDRAPGAAQHDLVLHIRSYEDEILPERRAIPGRRYFDAAFAEIRRKSGTLPEITLISDRPESARRMLEGFGAQVRIHGGGSAYGDLSAMLHARNLILTNSSFSWWGGFCSTAETVLYPRNDGFFHYPTPSRRFTCL